MQATDKEAIERAEGEAAVLSAIAAMTGTDRALGEQLHPIIKANAPELMPKTWYGMPAYANKDGKVICFFRPAQRFNDRFLTLGFNDIANLDDGAMWPMSYSVKELNPAEEAKIAALVKKAVS
jgi:uncharacterized protein YdhG (YjbR/CyaY superfamily)